MTTKPHVAILGAGPAGLGAAYALTRRALARVTVLEQNGWVGGTAASMDLAGVRADLGSHRLHPACDPEILSDVRELLGDDLLDRPRHGRIRLRGRWVHFPLKPFDLALHLPPSFALGVTADLARKVLGRGGQGDAGQGETFASVLEAGLGRTICQDFYFPYAQKLWGLAPEELSVTQARRRVSTGSLGKMVRKVLSAVPGVKSPQSGRFYYPRRGFGQISEALCQASIEGGATVHMDAAVKAVEIADSGAHAVVYDRNGQTASLQADYVWSTIPITALVRSLRPSPPPECMQAAEHLDYRGMILIYLVLEQVRFTEFDAHYFPEADIPISRLSEPKNYSGVREPEGRTVLCAELPCVADGPEWDLSDEELGLLVRRALDRAGIPVQSQIARVTTRRLRYAYPIYQNGYEDWLGHLEHWVRQIERLLTFGRHGLFAHDNAHHALYMGYAAARCLEADGRFDIERWHSYREVFETHVVVD